MVHFMVLGGAIAACEMQALGVDRLKEVKLDSDD